MLVLQERSEGLHKPWETGLKNLDEAINGGLRPGAMYVVGARPGQGKSALALSIAMHTAKERPTAFFSLEMGRADIFDRMVSALCDVPMSAVLRPYHENLDWNKVGEAANLAGELKLCLCDKGGLDINKVRAMARRLKHTRGLQVLVLDYIGLMPPSQAARKASANRAWAIEEVTRGLKALGAVVIK